MTRYRLTIANGVTIYPIAGLERHWTDPIDDQGRPCPMDRKSYGDEPALVQVEGLTETLTFHREIPGPILDYELGDLDLVSVRYPAQLSVEQWKELDSAGDENAYRYRARRGVGTVEQHVVSVADLRPWPIAPDEIPDRPDLPESAGSWTPGRAWALLFGIPTHDHIVPGYLSGFHKAARAAIDAHPNRARSWLGSEIRIERDIAGNVEFAFTHEDGLEQSVGKGRRKTKRPAFKSVRVNVRIGPDLVGGATLADAIVAWHARLAEVLEQLPDPAVICSHCRGAGFIRKGNA